MSNWEKDEEKCEKIAKMLGLKDDDKLTFITTCTNFGEEVALKNWKLDKFDEKGIEQIKDEVKIIDINPSLEFAYIAGVSEDAHLGKGGKQGYEFDIESKSKEHLQKSIAPRLKTLLKKSIVINKRETREYYRIRLWNKEIVQQLNMVKDNPIKVLSWEKAQQLNWVRGFIDAESSVTKSGENQPMLSIYNSNIEKLKVIEEILKPYGIHVNYYKHPDRNVWQQYFTGRKNLQKLLEVVQFEHPKRREKLASFL